MPELSEYTSLDNITVQVSEFDQKSISTHIRRDHGFTKVIPLKGIVGCSGLGFSMRITNTHGIVAWVRPEKPHYAFVLLEDGTITQGNFCLFKDGSFSLS